MLASVGMAASCVLVYMHNKGVSSDMRSVDSVNQKTSVVQPAEY